MEIIWRVISWDREVREGGRGTRIKKYKLVEQNRQEDVKNSIGNGVARELISMTHEHELGERIVGGKGVPGGGRQRGKIGTTVRA